MENIVKCEEMIVPEPMEFGSTSWILNAECITLLPGEDTTVKPECDLEDEIKFHMVANPNMKSEVARNTDTVGQFDTVYIASPHTPCEDNEILMSDRIVEPSNVSSELNNDKPLFLLCRLCAEQRDHMIQIEFDQTELNRNFIRKLENCLSIRIRRRDTLPKQVCRSCLEKLEFCHQFRRNVTDAEIRLRQLEKRMAFKQATRSATLLRNSKRNKARKDLYDGKQSKKSSKTVENSNNPTESSPGIQIPNEIIAENDITVPNLMLESSQLLESAETYGLNNSVNIFDEIETINIVDAENNVLLPNSKLEPMELFLTETETETQNLHNSTIMSEGIQTIGTVNTDNDTTGENSELESEELLSAEATNCSLNNSAKEKIKTRSKVKHYSIIHASPKYYFCHFCNSPFETKKEWDLHRSEHDEEKKLNKPPVTGSSKISETEFAANLRQRFYTACRKNKNSRTQIQSDLHPQSNGFSAKCSFCKKRFHSYLVNFHEKKCPSRRRIGVGSRTSTNRLQSNVLKERTSAVLQSAREQSSALVPFPSSRPVPSMVTRKREAESSLVSINTPKVKQSKKIFYSCAHCDQKFDQKPYLTGHIRTHIDQQSYSCKLCPRKFRTERERNIHKKFHQDAQLFKCFICKLTFDNISGLRIHGRIHSEKRKYECPLCQEKFDKEIARNDHMEIHAGQKFYECDLCKNCLKTKSNLFRHLTTVHKESYSQK